MHSPENDGESSVDHVMAYAPLSSVPWGVVLEQREDTALALPNSLRQRVLIIAAAGLVAGLAMAWITSQQVVLPLARLTEQAKRIAEGDLSRSIAPGDQDEVRRLAVSFGTMRGRMEKSQRELAEWSTELENMSASVQPSWSNEIGSGACCLIRSFQRRRMNGNALPETFTTRSGRR